MHTHTSEEKQIMEVEVERGLWWQRRVRNKQDKRVQRDNEPTQQLAWKAKGSKFHEFF